MKLFGLEMPAVFDEIRDTLRNLNLDFHTEKKDDGGSRFEISYNGGKLQIDMGKDPLDFKGIQIIADDKTEAISKKIEESIKHSAKDSVDAAEYYYEWEKKGKPLKRLTLYVVNQGCNTIFGGGAITAVWVAPWYEEPLAKWTHIEELSEKERLFIDPMVIWKSVIANGNPGILNTRRFYPIGDVDLKTYSEDEDEEDFLESNSKTDSFVEVGTCTLPGNRQVAMLYVRMNIATLYWNCMDAKVRGGKVYALTCLAAKKLLNHLVPKLPNPPEEVLCYYGGAVGKMMRDEDPISKEESDLQSSNFTIRMKRIPSLAGYEVGSMVANSLAYQMMAEQIASMEKELGFTTWWPDDEAQMDAALDHLSEVMGYVKEEYALDYEA